VSTKVGIIAEGPIDYHLIPALLERIARDRAGYDWPVRPDDLTDIFPIRKRGHGGVLDLVRRLVEALSQTVYDHAFFVILLDRRTRPVQEQVRQLISGQDRFVLGVAIEEIEAWWLGDRRNTLAWAHLAPAPPAHCRYAAADYHAESDPAPKVTLDESTRESERFDRFYGEGNVDMAEEFAEDYWKDHARLDDIRAQCALGYGPFEDATTQRFRRAAKLSGHRPRRRQR
jgi:hypothetical protein